MWNNTTNSTIQAELENLQAQVTAASPLTSASPPTLLAIQLNAAQLLANINTAITNGVGQLDVWIAPVDPEQIIDGVLELKWQATNQSHLVLMEGYVARSNLNLDQLVP